MTYDVIVLGLGAMGSAAAHQLASRGKRVLGIEQFGAAHSLGSSHGESRIIRQAYFEHPSYVPLLRRSYELWRRLEHDSEKRLLEQTGGLMIGPSDSPVVKGAIDSAQQHQLTHEVLTPTDMAVRFPAFKLRSGDVAMYEAVAGYLRPEDAVGAQLALATKAGAELHFQEAVQNWTAASSQDGVTVRTSKSTYQASRLVIAPGAWASDLLSALGVPFEVSRRVMCWFKPASNAANLQSNRFPVYIWDVDGVNIFYGFPLVGSAQLAKAAMHTGKQRCTAASINREISPEDVEEVRRYLTEFIPDASGTCERAAACMYTLTPDEHFVVASHPGYPQVAVAAGFSGHGFKFTPVIGEILADLALEGHTQQPIEFLSSARFLAPAS